MIDYLFSGDFRKIKEKLEKEMKSCGFLEAYDVPMKDGSLAYNLNLNIGPSSLGIDEIDLFIKTEGSFSLEKGGFFVEELDELQKVLSIFYGSPFSLTFEPIDVLWPRYSVCIQTAHLKTVEELKEHVCTLKLLLTKVSKMFSEKE
ncbi:hypothetical protein [Lactococcus petauri]|uniref:hypothetical protein n=1 Tax=Lactococcus petauri TaxID=1940789 RepID=UPI001F590C0E|nr:hypothetical protein [Lactococcus petauri]